MNTRQRIQKVLNARNINVALHAAENSPKFKEFKKEVEQNLFGTINVIASRPERVRTLLMWTKGKTPPQKLTQEVSLALGSKTVGDVDLQLFLSWVGSQGGQAAMDKLGIEGKFIMKNQALLDYFDNYKNLIIKTVDNTTKEWIAGKIQYGRENFLSPQEIADMLAADGKGISAVRANMIAVTETAKGLTYVELEAAKRYGIRQKTWHTSEDDRVEAQCIALDGKTVDINALFPGDLDGPPAHILCLAGETLILAEGVSKTYERRFEGEVVIINIAGKNITITPNHPVLTDMGWIAAGKLKTGDRLYQRLDWDNAINHPNNNEIVARIKDIGSALQKSGTLPPAVMKSAAEDFHGDGRANTEIDVISSHHFFPSNIRKKRDFIINKFFSRTHFPGIFLPIYRMLMDCFKRPLFPSQAIMGGLSPVSPLFSGNFLSLQSIPLTDGSGFKSHSFKSGKNAGMMGRDAPRDILERFAGKIALVKIDNIKRRIFNGHVYNLETKYGYYFAESIIVHNCRCFIDEVIPEDFQIPANPWTGD